MAQLIVITGPRAGENIEVEGSQVLGRGDADIVIEDPKLSRRHLSLRAAEGGIEVEDLGSLNGTTVGGERISKAVVVRPGERVKLGDTTLEVAPEPANAEATVLGTVPEAEGTVFDRPPVSAPDVTEVPPAPASAEPPPAPPPPAAPPPAAPPPAVPPPAAPPPAAPAPAAPARSTPADQRHSHGPAASLLWVPTVISIAIIVGTVVALIIYFGAVLPSDRPLGPLF